MRNIHYIISEMIEKVPVEQKDFTAQLEKIKKDSSYTAPEVMIERWYELSYALWFEFGEIPTEDWQWEVTNILMDRDLDYRNFIQAKD